MIRHPHHASFGGRSLSKDVLSVAVRLLMSIEHFIERGFETMDVRPDDTIYHGF